MLVQRFFFPYLAAATACLGISIGADNGEYFTLPSLREQAKLQDAWTQSRIDGIPALLRKHGVDAWLMSQKEYAEDTVFWSLKSAKQFSARRRTLQLFLADASTTGKTAYTWIDNTPTVWDELRSVLQAANAEKIAVNIDTDVAFASGLHAGEYEKIRTELDQGESGLSEKLVSVPLLAVEFVGTMPSARLPWYKKLQGTAWAMIAEAFSEAVITPGSTTTEDVEWWLRDKIQAQNYSTWFAPAVQVVRPGADDWKAQSTADIIHYGDMLHVDFGVTALGINTDTQHLAYVLFPGETERDVPKGLLEGLKKANRLQDIVRTHMKVGRTGNEVLRVSLDEMHNQGMEGLIYSHPIGDWGHSAGTLIGMTNLQSKVPVLGDLPLLSHTYYSIELLAKHFVPEYNATMSFYQEEDVAWQGVDEHGNDVWEWVWGRQERFHLIRTEAKESTKLRTQN